MDRKIVTVKSYANIAIIKYWGKADAAKMIPATSSISLTLENMFTTTSVSFLPDSASHDEFYINGVLQDDKEHAKISAIIDQYRGQRSEYVKQNSLKKQNLLQVPHHVHSLDHLLLGTKILVKFTLFKQTSSLL